MTRLVAVADLHGNLPTDLPGGDVLVIAGDVCPLSDHAVAFQRSWLVEELYPWMDALPHPEIVWIAGNHDFACQSPGWEPGGRGTYLLDEGTTAAGLSFHGTPWVPNLRRWAFYGDDDLRSAKTALIPQVDVLVSHGPPRGTGDRARPRFRGRLPVPGRPPRGGAAATLRLRPHPRGIRPLGAPPDDACERRLRRRELRRPPQCRPRLRVRPRRPRQASRALIPTRTGGLL